ncbi:hypothetical protein [Lelliottia wanjuensis]|uniref:hypothetical protein n=1 Tax=Lelliottia wanjuensis TaxID=3050585 RepID=UPI00254CB5BD|nr:hypothetical protein [Lelliottia sp. V104_15]MDK9605352.1 hypothetical protein [Lelliottia sp. V104_15]
MNKTSKLLSLAFIFTGLELLFIYNDYPTLFLITNLFSIVFLIVVFYSFSWLKLDDDNLLKQPLFIASILVPLHTFLVYGLWVWKDHNIAFTSDGFSNFLNITKLPLIILASSAPLAAIVNNIHRTIQTKKQIRIAEANNLGSSFHTQQKHLIDIFNNFPEYKIGNEKTEGYDGLNFSKKLKIKYPRRIFKRMYTKSNVISGPSYTTGAEIKLFIRFFWNEVESIINETINNNEEYDFYYIHELEKLIFSFMKEMGISFIEQKHSNTQQSRKFMITTNFFTTSDISETLQSIYSICEEIYAIIGAPPDFVKIHSETDDLLNLSWGLFENFGRSLVPTTVRRPTIMRLLDIPRESWEDE